MDFVIAHDRRPKTLVQREYRKEYSCYERRGAQKREISSKQKTKYSDQIDNEKTGEGQKDCPQPIHAEQIERPGQTAQPDIADYPGQKISRPQDCRYDEQGQAGKMAFDDRQRGGAPENIKVEKGPDGKKHRVEHGQRLQSEEVGCMVSNIAGRDRDSNYILA